MYGRVYTATTANARVVDAVDIDTVEDRYK